MRQHTAPASLDERNPARITVSDRPKQFDGSSDAILQAPNNADATPVQKARRVEMSMDMIDGVRSVCFQLQDVHTIPFNYRVAGSHAWKYLLQSHEHEHRQGIYRVRSLRTPMVPMLAQTLIAVRLCR